MSLRPLPAMTPLLLGSLRTLGRSPQGPVSLGSESLRFQAPALTDASLQAYQVYFGGFTSSVPLPFFYPLAQRAQLALMLESAFPYAVPGMIHVANDMKFVASVDPALPFELTVTVAPVPDSGRLRFGVSVAQAGQTRLECQSLYQPRGVKVSRGDRPAPAPFEAAPESRREAWSFSADEGLRYARLSGDFNPIHLAPFLSRWFGFPRPILHGMNAVGRGVACIERATGQPVTAVSVTFKKPIPLPSAPIFLWEPSGHFDVASQDLSTRHLEGQFSTQGR